MRHNDSNRFGLTLSLLIALLNKEKTIFLIYGIRNSEGIGCKVIYEEELPYTLRKAQIISHI
jgi:hypothetical protein